MANFNSAAKRKRELAKLDKRHAKDQKRAVRKAERSGNVGAALVQSAVIAEPLLAKQQPAPGAAPARRPTTLTEAVEVWRRTKVAKPTKR